MNDNPLILKARAAMEYAYSPYSKFKVGAAIQTEDGTIYTGCNIENVSFGATNCAERTAIFKAISQTKIPPGQKIKIKILAIASSNSPKEPIYPCGICRQVFAEFNDPNDEIDVIVDGDQKIYKLSELLPHSFNKF